MRLRGRALASIVITFRSDCLSDHAASKSSISLWFAQFSQTFDPLAIIYYGISRQYILSSHLELFEISVRLGFLWLLLSLRAWR